MAHIGRKKLIFGLAAVMLIGCVYLLNQEVTYRQGINYRVYLRRIPLYLKLMDYVSRHVHYKMLTEEIIREKTSEKDKVLALFDWTYENIRPVPEQLPVVDDHILNIIIRGYGTFDQSSDVFCALCEYAGIPAAWTFISPKQKDEQGPPLFAVSLVELEGQKRVFDPYFGNYFINQNGDIASVDDLITNPDLIDQAQRKPVLQGVEYKNYFTGLSDIDETDLWKRGKTQMPVQRVLYEVKKLLGT